MMDEKLPICDKCKEEFGKKKVEGTPTPSAIINSDAEPSMFELLVGGMAVIGGAFLSFVGIKTFLRL